MAAEIRTPPSAWVDAGLHALSTGGPGAIRVEALAKTLGVTKGGFYGHFADRGALIEEMLATWERRSTDLLFESVEREGGDARAPDLADDAVWLNGFSWQGGDFFTAPLEKIGDGVYRTAQPLPVFGQWKTGIRVHVPNRMMGLAPIYAPADPAANAPAIDAASGPREFMSEIEFLQRERKSETPAVLWTIAYATVGLIFAAMWALFAWLYAAAATARRREVSVG